MKKKLIALTLAAVLAISMLGCGSKEAADNSSSTSAPQEEEQTSSLMDKDVYLAEVEGVNSAAEDFMNALMNAMKEGADMGVVVEEIRATKDAFIAFSEIDNPPEGYEEAHSRLAESSGKFGDFIDRYADLLRDANDGTITDTAEYDEKADALATEMEEITTELGNAMGEVQAIQ